jgi:signal transduction histidine kinase/plastocyanin
MIQPMWRTFVAVVLGVAAAAALVGTRSPIAMLLVVAFVAMVGGPLRAKVSEQTRARAARIGNVFFAVFFTVYLVAASVFLLAGLAPAVVRAVPTLHTSLHRWGVGATRGVEIVARGNAFDTRTLTLPEQSVQIRFSNLDIGVPHNVAIYERDGKGIPVFRGEMIVGSSTTTYRFDSPLPGAYTFVCDTHPEAMVGTVLVTIGGSGDASNASWFARTAERIAAASHGSALAAATTGQDLVAPWQVAANYVFSLFTIVLVVLLIRARPRDWTARFLALGMVGTAAVFNSQAHAAFHVLPGVATDTAHQAFHLVSGVSYMIGLLLFPDGHLVPRLSRATWYRGALRALLLFLFAAVGLFFASSFHGTDAAGYVGIFGVIIPVAGVISQAFRYRRADDPAVRQQSRLLMWALAIAFTATLATIGLIAAVDALRGEGTQNLGRAVFLVFPLLFMAIPLTLVLVLIRYRLWDLEQVVNKALVYGTLAGFTSVVYVGIVVGVGSAIGSGGGQNLGLSIVATAVVAMAFEPLRARLQRLANVLVYGRRATPYEVLSDFSDRIARSITLDEILPRMAEAAARGVDAERGKVSVVLPDGQVRSAMWPLDADDGEWTTTITVRHGSDLVGDIWVAKPADQALTPAEGNLLNDLANQAGAALRNVQLTAELQEQLEQISAHAAQLQASRQRLVRAQDAAARRLERDLHDGAQQQLIMIALTARLAREVADQDPQRSRQLLADVGALAQDTLDTVRDLARGVYPPLLAEAGLATALDAHVKKVAMPVTIDSSGGLGRYPPESEAAVYFCCLEALQNVRKYAHATSALIHLTGGATHLDFTVTDDGIGFDEETTPQGSGLQNMTDRIAALGGSLTIRSRPGAGTVVAGTIPVGPIATSSEEGLGV